MAGGAYIEIKDGNIFIHAPGKIDFKAAQFSFGKGTKIETALPVLPKAEESAPFNLKFQFVDDSGKPYINQPYRAFLPDGSEKTGTTDANGFVQPFWQQEEQHIYVHLTEKEVL